MMLYSTIDLLGDLSEGYVWRSSGAWIIMGGL